MTRIPGLALPRAAALMLWAGSYLRGDTGPDDAAHAVSADDGDLFGWLTDLRQLPLVQLRLALPVPGRIAGLVGPPAAVQAALQAGQALVVTAAGIADHTLVPESERWARFPAPIGAQLPPPVSSGTAREQLLHALRDAARTSADLDLVPEEPIAPGTLPEGWIHAEPPRRLSAADAHLLELAGRLLVLSAQEIDAGPAQARALAEEQARRRVLEQLRDAAREALIETVERAADISAR